MDWHRSIFHAWCQTSRSPFHCGSFQFSRIESQDLRSRSRWSTWHWFYSLDANQPLAVWIARLCFALPYQHAAMHTDVDGGEIAYSSVRLGSAETLHYRYRPTLDIAEAAFGSLEFFLLERYRLFAHRRGRLLTGRVYHAPYRLGKAIVHELDSHLFKLDGFEIPSEPPAHAAYVRRVDVSIYPIALAK